MKTLRTVGLSLGVLFALAPALPAVAGTLASGSLSPTSGGSHRCWATNASKRSRSLTVEILDDDGRVVASRECSVAGWESCPLTTTAPGRAYCRITTSGSTRSVVGSLEVRDSRSQPVAALPID